MSETDKILAKIRKLFALATSSNVHEASAAAAAAQRLMAEHEIQEAELDLSEPTREQSPVGVQDYEKQARTCAWKNAIVHALARANGARAWKQPQFGGGCTMKIAGSERSITTIRYLHAHLCTEVERLCKAERPRDVIGKAWSNAFKLGAAYELSTRIMAEAKVVRAEAQQAGKGAALALIDSERGRVAALVPRLVKGRRTRVSNVDGYVQGQLAGRAIRIGGHASLGRGCAANLHA